MAKFNFKWWHAVMLLIILALSSASTGNFVGSIGGEDIGEPVFCNDYEFLCCGLKEESNTVTISKNEYFEVPKNAYECELESFSGESKIGIGTECEQDCGFFGCTYDCDSSYTLWSNDLPIDIGKEEWVWSTFSTGNLRYNLRTERLAWCGPSACDAGVTGTTEADGSCYFVTDESIYNENGEIEEEVSSGDISYTVPPGECYLVKSDRHVCAYTNEQCDSDYDCVSGHTYTYQGLGAECSTGQVEMYGCSEYGQPIGKEIDLFPEDSEPNNYGTRCEVVARESVECCPGTGVCGTNAFCSTETFTCRPEGEVGCNEDEDCGTKEWCDRDTKELKKPVCINDECGWEKITEVECCYDADCPQGWYCDGDAGYVCREGGGGKTTCPFECCVGDSKYFDRPCEPDEECINHQCIHGGTEDKCYFDSITKMRDWLNDKLDENESTSKYDLTCIHCYLLIAILFTLFLLIALPPKRGGVGPQGYMGPYPMYPRMPPGGGSTTINIGGGSKK